MVVRFLPTLPLTSTRCRLRLLSPYVTRIDHVGSLFVISIR